MELRQSAQLTPRPVMRELALPGIPRSIRGPVPVAPRKREGIGGYSPFADFIEKHGIRRDEPVINYPG